MVTNIESGYLNLIQKNYGTSIAFLFKTFMNINSKIANFTSRKTFLIRCRKYGIFPPHIINNIKCLFTNMEPNMPFNNKIRNIQDDIKRKILNVEIEITFWKITSLTKTLNTIRNQLESKSISNSILEEFFKTQSRVYFNLLNSKLINVNRKFDFLKNEQFNNFNLGNNNWCYNLTKTIIPNNIIQTISLGPKFALPIFEKKDIPCYKMLAETESIIKIICVIHTIKILIKILLDLRYATFSITTLIEIYILQSKKNLFKIQFQNLKHFYIRIQIL